MSEENSNGISRIGTVDGGHDPYDHAITLVDTTVPQQDLHRQQTITGSQSQDQGSLRRTRTKTSVKDQLLRRKYAKWREPDRTTTKVRSTVTLTENANTENDHAVPDEHDQHGVPEEVDDLSAVLNSVDKIKGGDTKSKRKELKSRRKEKKDSYEVDILYECQRGSFFFGIPLYSHSSLLNFDPSPWVNKDFKDSAVNITNAQVPDPSWVWAWKTWYVDMSYDVDEEGWQYSFAFGGKFSWHGTHPWFHSFVRRRRWLRKRVKKDLGIDGGKAGSMTAGHKFTNDYFTIHPKREQSPSSALDGEGKTLGSVNPTALAELEQPPDEVKDIASLLKALRFANVDREKIEMIKQFVREGGDELAYLAENVPHLMSVLVFQNSKRQILSLLKQQANDAQQNREEHDAEEKQEAIAESRRIDDLLLAVDTANKEIKGLEYWSDRKHILETSESTTTETQNNSPTSDVAASRPKADDHHVETIQGISSRAEIEKDPNHEALHMTRRSQEGSSNKKESKGKEKEVIPNHPEENNQAESPPRLGRDQVLIPDDDS